MLSNDQCFTNQSGICWFGGTTDLVQNIVGFLKGHFSLFQEVAETHVQKLELQAEVGSTLKPTVPSHYVTRIQLLDTL